MTTHDTAGKVSKNNSGKVTGRQAPRKGPPLSLALERKWRRIISQWKASGLEGRAFIREHGLPEASFYGWKRTLRLRDEERARLAKRRVPGKVSKGAASHRQGKGKRVTVAKTESAAPAFVPVSVTPPPVTAAIELALAGGRTLRIPAGFDAATLTRLLSVLERS